MEIKCSLSIHKAIMVEIFLSIAGEVRGLESLWFIGDEFCDRSFTSYVKQVKNPKDKGWFIQENYELIGVTATQYSSQIHNVLARFKNHLNNLIKQEKLLPKAVVIVRIPTY